MSFTNFIELTTWNGQDVRINSYWIRSIRFRDEDEWADESPTLLSMKAKTAISFIGEKEEFWVREDAEEVFGRIKIAEENP